MNDSLLCVWCDAALPPFPDPRDDSYTCTACGVRYAGELVREAIADPDRREWWERIRRRDGVHVERLDSGDLVATEVQ
jgi:hypothetical protein